MKTKLNKILTVITALTFAAALTLNIQASLSDPFAGMSDEAIIQTTSDTSGETTGADGYKLLVDGSDNVCFICFPNYPNEECNVSDQCCIYTEPYCNGEIPE